MSKIICLRELSAGISLYPPASDSVRPPLAMRLAVASAVAGRTAWALEILALTSASSVAVTSFTRRQIRGRPRWCDRFVFYRVKVSFFGLTLPPRLSRQPLWIHGFYRLVFSRRVQ